MDLLDLNLTVFGEKVKELTGIYSKISICISNLDEYVENLDIFWDGDANSAYITRVSRDLTEAAAITIRLRSAIKCIKTAVELYAANEKEVNRIMEEILYG